MEAAGIQSFLMNLYRCIDRSRIQFDFLVQYKADEFYDKEIKDMGGRIYKFSVREDYNLIRYRKEIRTFFEQHKEYKIIHGHMETLSNIWESEAARANVRTIICHSHTAGFNEKNPIKLIIKQLYRHYYGTHADLLFACSNAAGNFMFPGRKYQLIPNAINVEKYKYSEAGRDLRKELGINECFVIGHVGRFHPSKNHAFILEVMQQLSDLVPNAKALLIGDGDIREQISEDIRKKNIEDKVLMLGNRQDVNLLYSAMDAFIMPSYFEGLPLVGVEAQSSGLPCIFSENITNELQITDLATFLPIDGNSPKLWADQLAEISNLKIDRRKYAAIVGENGYDIKTLSEILTQKYEGLYR